MLAYSYFSSAQQLMSASRSALTAISAAGKVEEILDMDTSRPFDRSLSADPAALTASAWSTFPMATRGAAAP